MLRSTIDHLVVPILRTRYDIFMKKFYGLIKEVWAKYKDVKFKLSPTPILTMQHFPNVMDLDNVNIKVVQLQIQ